MITKGGEKGRESETAQKKRLGKDSWMRGRDRLEERGESKSQLMLFQQRRGKKKTKKRRGKKPKQMRQVNKREVTE